MIQAKEPKASVDNEAFARRFSKRGRERVVRRQAGDEKRARLFAPTAEMGAVGLHPRRQRNGSPAIRTPARANGAPAPGGSKLGPNSAGNMWRVPEYYQWGPAKFAGEDGREDKSARRMGVCTGSRSPIGGGGCAATRKHRQNLKAAVAGCELYGGSLSCRRCPPSNSANWNTNRSITRPTKSFRIAIADALTRGIPGRWFVEAGALVLQVVIPQLAEAIGRRWIPGGSTSPSGRRMGEQASVCSRAALKTNRVLRGPPQRSVGSAIHTCSHSINLWGRELHGPWEVEGTLSTSCCRLGDRGASFLRSGQPGRHEH